MVVLILDADELDAPCLVFPVRPLEAGGFPDA
jgi:hypothetical protein